MAKKRGYYLRSRRRPKGRRLVLVVGLAVVAVLVIWQWASDDAATPGADTERLNSRLAGHDEATTPAVAPEPTLPTAAPRQDKVVEPPVEAGASQAAVLFEAGGAAMGEQDYLSARTKLSEALETGLTGEAETLARRMLSLAADQWLFSANVFENDGHCSRYKVVTGDRLSTIAKRFVVPMAFLARVNQIRNPNNLAAGRTIKVVQGPFRVKVERSRFLMSVYLGEVLVRSYVVGLGSPGRVTPTGRWRVKIKQENPDWSDPDTGRHYTPNDPDNPLGEHWIGLDGLEGDAKGRTGFGIHGTSKPQEIGEATSRGCIRLNNGDAQELYDMLLEGKSEVLVVD